MKLYQKILIIIMLIVIFIYVCNISLLPNNIILNQGEELDIKTIYGITVSKDQEQQTTMQASSNLNKKKIDDVGSIDVSLNLFGKIPVKNMNINVISKTKVIPIGKAVGMKLYTDGVLVVGMSEINGRRPYENCGIQEGDTIIQINNEKIEDTNDLIEVVNESQGRILEISYKRKEEIKRASIEPAKTENDEYKLGLWVRDATAGVRYNDFLRTKFR